MMGVLVGKIPTTLSGGDGGTELSELRVRRCIVVCMPYWGGDSLHGRGGEVSVRMEVRD